MKIQPYLNFNIVNNSHTQKNIRKPNNDTVSFSAKRTDISIDERMSEYAINLLKEQNLQKGQPLYIKGDSYYLPFMETLSKEAYKMNSGHVHIEVTEPVLEKIKEKFNKNGLFEYQKQRLKEYKESDALFIEFNLENDPYKKAKVFKKEVLAEIAKYSTPIPQKIRNLFKLNPKEILVDALDMKKGQPIVIFAEREHVPFIKKILNFLYSKNNTDLVDINLTNKNYKNEMMYGANELFETLQSHEIQQLKEYYDKDVAWLRLYGRDPEIYADVPSEKLARSQKLNNSNDLLNEYSAKLQADVPWLVYNLPTVLSSVSAYPELANDKLQLIAKAYEDATKINRTGQLKEHIDSLAYRAKKMNELIQNGYRTFHYISVNPNTQLPDGKTDFKVKVTPKSVFNSASVEMSKYGHCPIVNIPTEEVFTAPQSDSANGVLSATMPLSLNGKIVDGIKLTFKDGEVVDVKADKNEDILKNFIKDNKNANRLGELAIVAGSPIAQTGRIFNSTLLDENAACHFALGNAYSDTVMGADDIEDYKEQKQYLENNKINVASVHADFMVGGKNVYVTAINEETGDTITVLKNDKFLL